MIVVADSSPVRYLVQIDEIRILPALVGAAIVPWEVLHELPRIESPREVSAWMASPPVWLRIANTAHIGSFPRALRPGERSAIAPAEEVDADLLLLDHRAARRECHRRRLAIWGTLGVLALAARRGLTDLPAAIYRLSATNFRARPQLIRFVLDSASRNA